MRGLREPREPSPFGSQPPAGEQENKSKPSISETQQGFKSTVITLHCALYSCTLLLFCVLHVASYHMTCLQSHINCTGLPIMLFVSLRVTGGELFEDIVAREYYSEADAR